MTLHHRCPQCPSLLAAPDGFAGRRVRCPACGADLVLPRDDHSDEAEALFYAEPVGAQTEASAAASDSATTESSEPSSASQSPPSTQSTDAAQADSAAKSENESETDAASAWQVPMLESFHGPAEVKHSYEPPIEAEPAEPSHQPAAGEGWGQRMLTALLDPRSIQWLLALGGGLMVLGGLIWLISRGALQQPLVAAAILGVGSFAVLGSGWWLALKTRYQMAGRALTFLGCVCLSLNLWFYHAQDLLPLDRGLWMAAVVCVVVYVATVRLLRDPLFLYAVQAGVTLTAVLLLGNFGHADSATHLSVLLMTLAMISIHGRLGFPEGKEEFNRERFGMPLFWCGHMQLAAAVGVLLGSQIAGWVQVLGRYVDLPPSGILLTNSRWVPGLLWLVAAYAYFYSDLSVRRVGVYMYLAAGSLIMAEATVIGMDAWGLEGLIMLLAVTSGLISLFAAASPGEDARLARVVAPLAFLIGLGPMLLALWLHMTGSSMVALSMDLREPSWMLVAAMLVLAASNRVSAFSYRHRSPGLAGVYLFFSAAAILMAAAALLHVQGILAWQSQTALLMLIPIGYLIAARLWRGHSPEKPLAWIAQTAVVALVVRAFMGAALEGWSLESGFHLSAALMFAQLTLFYGLARWLRAYHPYTYFSVAAGCLTVAQAMSYWQLPGELYEIAFATIGLAMLVASRLLGVNERLVFSSTGEQNRLSTGVGAEVSRAGHALLSLTLLSSFLQSASEVVNGGFSGFTASGLDWIVLVVVTIAALAGAMLSEHSAWRRTYVLAAVGMAVLTLIHVNIAIDLGFWRKAEILLVGAGIAMLVAGYVGRFREDDGARRNDLVSLCLTFGSMAAIGPLLLAVWIQWYQVDRFSAPDDLAFITVSLLMLATGIVWRVKASTICAGGSLAAYLAVLTVSVIYHPQVAIGIYLAAGGALLFGMGLVLAICRDRIAAIPRRVAQREGVFSVIAWR